MKNISIIIPVYNNFGLTLQCINSIKKHCKNIEYEIIISDDCSTDETKEFFLSQDEIIYVRNEKNRGFSYTCNRGAEVAKGEYLLFLNNDTLLIDNILTKFISTFENYSNAGIIGAKLLYEDNTIQHGGVMIYPYKNVGHLFKNFPTDYPDANKVRKLQSVTGACLAIPSKLFFDAGKFDENFINGFEDLDLCLRIKYNYKKEIIYNPEISLYHFEEKTRTINKNRFDEHNKLIIEKWQSKVKPDFFLLDEGYDYKLNDILEFYLIKNKININEQNLFLAIKKEPLYFAGYKQLISELLDANNFNEAEKIAFELIKFEPTVDNYRIIESIYKIKRDLNKLTKVREIINNFIEHRLQLKNKVEQTVRYLTQTKKDEIAKYYNEWLENFGF